MGEGGMTTLCGCGKPTTHKGMCSARWAKRKANNGPAGKKAKPESEPAAAPMSEEAIARRLFGDMADDILLLRGRGRTVARFKEGFRVDRLVLTADEVSAMAKALRERPTRARAANTEITPADGAASTAKSVTAQAAAPPKPEWAEQPPQAAPPAMVPDPQDLTTRVAQLEHRIDRVADVLGELATELRNGA